MPLLPADVHSRAGAELAAELASSASQGLSDQEAERRLGIWGPNALGDGGGSPAWRRFLGQFHDPLLKVFKAQPVLKVKQEHKVLKV